jgi:glycosyltransferase involved in cell wall biosynthesis
MRLGVYSDFAYRRTPAGLETDQAFVLFAAALAASVERLVLIGRLDPSTEPSHHRVPAAAAFAPLPHYGALSDPVAVVRAGAATLRAFWRALDDLDAVWLLGPHPFSVLFALAALLRRRRVVLGVRQHLPAYARHRHPGRRPVLGLALALEAAYRLLALALPTIVVGPDLARRYRFGREVLAIPVSLTSRDDLLQRPPPSWDGELTALSVGRLDPEKNPLLLADVLAALPARWRLEVCGEGSLHEALARRLDELGVADRAALRGYVPVDGGLQEAYRAAHALLHVSWTEGVPQVLVEAFGAGLPVVATAVGGVAEVAEGAALLIGPGDAAAAAAALERLREEPELRLRHVAAGRAVAARHTVEAIAERVARFAAG